MNKKKILVVDDELSIIKFLRAVLKGDGYEVLVAMDGAEAIQTIESELPDLIILDIMMPNTNGIEVCRQVREWSQIPIIMLSARGDENDKVECLKIGADDYITKPFGKNELLARVEAVMRRTQTEATVSPEPALTIGELDINFARRQITLGKEHITLTPTEYNLFQELVLNAGKVLTHSHLLAKVWGPDYTDEREYLHVFVRRLRSKIEPDPAESRYILTVPGVGYQFINSS
jgi:two-component system KDP operon response regulator KdpE